MPCELLHAGCGNQRLAGAVAAPDPADCDPPPLWLAAGGTAEAFDPELSLRVPNKANAPMITTMTMMIPKTYPLLPMRLLRSLRWF